MADIDSIFSMLSWDSDERTQQEGIREAQKIEHLSILFQPIESKSVWENCARIISSKNDDILEQYLFLMFEWLQDINWPGAEIIFDRLLSMPIDVLKFPYQYSLDQAKSRKDVPWEMCLINFQMEYQVRTGDDSLS
jgi:hypothetical protein